MKQCCERDHDHDGNCDRHPPRGGETTPETFLASLQPHGDPQGWTPNTVKRIWFKVSPKSGIIPLPEFFEAIADAHNAILAKERSSLRGKLDRLIENSEQDAEALLHASSDDTKRLDWWLTRISECHIVTLIKVVGDHEEMIGVPITREAIDAAMRKDAK